MSLRFFRKKAKDKDAAEEKKSVSLETDKKKSASAETDTKKSASAEEQKKPSRGRGRRSSASSASKPNEPASEQATSSRSSATKKPAEAETSSSSSSSSATSAQKSSNGRRRGRRGGAGRKSTAAKADESKTPAKAPTADPGSLESIMSAQQAALQELAAQQVSTLKGLQGSLSAIENRLTASGTERSSALADRPRIGIFVDVPNIVYGAERERVSLDFGRVLEFIIGGRELVRASAYAPISDDPEEELETQKFVQPFTDLGYRIVTKPLKRYSNGTIKANFDVELAIDVLTMSDRLDIVVLLSGDGDFRRLVEIVASKGVRVEVVAFGNSTAAELRAVADTYTDLNDHLKELRVKR
jgi:uncharacterized LabA/DUF88 family protein